MIMEIICCWIGFLNFASFAFTDMATRNISKTLLVANSNSFITTHLTSIVTDQVAHLDVLRTWKRNSLTISSAISCAHFFTTRGWFDWFNHRFLHLAGCIPAIFLTLCIFATSKRTCCIFNAGLFAYFYFISALHSAVFTTADLLTGFRGTG